MGHLRAGLKKNRLIHDEALTKLYKLDRSLEQNPERKRPGLLRFHDLLNAPPPPLTFLSRYFFSILRETTGSQNPGIWNGKFISQFILVKLIQKLIQMNFCLSLVHPCSKSVFMRLTYSKTKQTSSKRYFTRDLRQFPFVAAQLMRLRAYTCLSFIIFICFGPEMLQSFAVIL